MNRIKIFKKNGLPNPRESPVEGYLMFRNKGASRSYFLLIGPRGFLNFRVVCITKRVKNMIPEENLHFSINLLIKNVQNEFHYENKGRIFIRTQKDEWFEMPIFFDLSKIGSKSIFFGTLLSK